MPPLEQGPRTPLEWLILTGLGLGLLWGLIMSPGFRCAAGFVALMAIVSDRIVAYRLRRLARTRTDDIGTFARSLDFRNTDTWLIRAGEEGMNRCLPGKLRPFPLRITDTCELLHIDPEVFDDAAEIAAVRAGYSLEKLEDNPYYGSVNTFGELILCLQAQPRILEER